MKTTKEQFTRRRAIAAGLGFTGALATTPAHAGLFDFLKSEPVVIDPTAPTTLAQYRGYSNGYEFGQSKDDPAEYEHTMDTSNWRVQFDKHNLSLDQLRGRAFEDLQSEWFNFRCVEAWGMYVNYNGLPFAELLREFGDTSKKYVAFECIQQEGLRGQNRRGFSWPYVEALTMEEAMNPLTWAVFGNYGAPSVANGAPFRVNIPWKYGFKSPKWVTKITCTDEKPPATWNEISSREYGWYSNVYPEIDHPRWRQNTHRHITEAGTNRVDTLIYNGYEEQVAHMYPEDNWEYR